MKFEVLGSKSRTLQPSAFRPSHNSRQSRFSRLSRATQPSRASLVLVFLMLSVMGGAASWAEGSDVSSAQSFQIGEQLTYDISWLYITAGTAVMTVSDAGTDGDRRLAKLITTAQSRPAITKFFPVDNRVESIVDPATMLPEHLFFK